MAEDDLTKKIEEQMKKGQEARRKRERDAFDEATSEPNCAYDERFPRCKDCGGWGKDLVGPNGLCAYCTVMRSIKSGKRPAFDAAEDEEAEAEEEVSVVGAAAAAAAAVRFELCRVRNWRWGSKLLQHSHRPRSHGPTRRRGPPLARVRTRGTGDGIKGLSKGPPGERRAHDRRV